ncbi:MAG: TonB family protein [Edaphobacter sp.]|nr:TonB family protein [Edaphobacter sp.]
MFEDSLVESRVGQVSSSKRWTMLASIGLQVAVTGVVMVLPLLHPEGMPFRVEALKVVMPLMPKPPVPVVVQRESAASSSSVAIPGAMRPEAATSLLPSLYPVVGDPPPLTPIGSGMRMTDGLPDGLAVGGGNGPAVSVAPVRMPIAPLHVSTGVLQGMLLAPIRPVYPAIAKAARVQGTVIVEAVISRKGTIESLRVVSGAAMLQNAALEAIREARYQPFRLNGEPTEVQTTITVNFRLGG